jgi:Putative adhesin
MTLITPKRKQRTAVTILGGLAGVLIVLFGAVAVVNAAFAHQRRAQFAVSDPVHQVVVASGAGDISLVATDTDRVIVRQDTHWVTGKATPRHSVSGGVLRLADGCKRHWPIFRCATSYRIEVPRDVAVDAHSDAGDVRVRGAGGSVSMTSDAGDVEATGLTGAHVRAGSDAGDVHLAFAAAPSSVDAETDAGDVEVTLPRGEYAVSTHTDAGDTTIGGIVRNDRSPHVVDARSDAGDVTVGD